MAEFVDSLIAELSPNGALSRNVRTSNPGAEATDMKDEPRNQIDAGPGEETSPVQPETNGSSEPDEDALPDPFAGRGTAAPVSGDSPGPKESGRAGPPKSR